MSPADPGFRVVALGASAGGLEPLQEFFAATAPGNGHAYVVAQHLSPDFKSLMPELIQRYTAMPVVSVIEDVALAPDTIYVLSPGLLLTLDGEMLRTHKRQASSALEFPISTLFESMAVLGPRAVAIVLSGTGSDGTAGAQRLHAAGALVIAQAPTTARFEAMPRGVIDSGCADIVAHPRDMPRAIAAWVADPTRGHLVAQAGPAGDDPATSGPYAPLLSILNATYNIDFEHYKPGTIVRRIERRLLAGPAPVTPQAYADRLSTDREELDRLFSDLLVGVTRFFRDEEAYAQLKELVLDPAIQALPPQDELRIWSCGCSTGEEAYSLAIVAMELFERHGRRPRLRVLATDLHGAALQTASQGVYQPDALAVVPEDLRQRYFVLQPTGVYKVSDELRRAVIFSAHNVLQDAAFTRIDLVVCRNLLIYLQPQAQRRALAAFHFALRAPGALFLGESEGVTELPGTFEPMARASHLYRKLLGSRVPADLRGPMLARSLGRLPLAPLDLRAGKRLDELLLQQHLPDSLLVNARHELMHVYGDAAQYLVHRSGRYSGDLSSLLPPWMRTPVSVALRKAGQEGHGVLVPDLRDPERPERRISAEVCPVTDRSLPHPVFLIKLRALAGLDRVPGGAASSEVMDDGPAMALEQVEELESELARVREALQNTVEELESANEELQAGNEELMAANEELQSTNEELHAVNEELYSVNAEHESKITELREATQDLHNLIRATELAILFLDNDLGLRMFTPPAALLFPLQPRDVGRNLRDFMPREADDTLFADLQAAVGGEAVADREFALRDGRWLRRRVSPYRDTAGRTIGLVLTYVDISEQIGLRARQAQRAKEEMLRDVALSLPHLLWKCDERGNRVWVSPQMSAYFGSSADTLLVDAERTDRLTVHPDDLDGCRAARARALQEAGAVSWRYRLRRHDGEYRWHAAQMAPLTQGAGPPTGWIGSATDVHDLVEAQHQVEDRQFLQLVADNSRGMLAYWDRDCVVRFANRPYQNGFGGRPNEVVGRSARELLGEPLWEQIRAHVEACLDQGEERTFERELTAPDGTTRHALAHFVPDRSGDSVRGMFVTVSDVTPLTLARRTLEDLLSALPVAVLIVGHDGSVLRANDEAMRLCGQDRFTSIEDLIPAGQRVRHQQQRQGFQAHMEPRAMGHRSTARFPLLRPDGTTIDVAIGLAPVSYRGQPATAAVIQDLRALDLSQARERARADSARTTFLATMSHEIRTPLNAIVGMTQLLELESPTPSQAVRLHTIEDATRHLLDIVNDVLDLAQIESGKLRTEQAPFSLADVVRRSLDLVGDRARLKHLELTSHIDPELPDVLVGDARRIEQVLVNLLSNAVKFTPTGSVRVRVEGRAVASGGLQLRVAVRDTGVGIAEADTERLFLPFEQIDQKAGRRFGGTGLGLAISRHLARAMGGECGARSQLGEGSEFWFTVLVGTQPSAARAGGARSAPAAARAEQMATVRAWADRRLLVVEDDRVNQIILVQLLRSLGVDRVEVAEDGQAAVAEIAKGGFDLVFMDIQLPGLDGLEATRLVRALGSAAGRVPIVALTANVLQEDVARCIDAGADSHMPKPVAREELAETLWRFLGPAADRRRP